MMTKEEIIEMGMQAGISKPVLLLGNNLKLLIAFAKLVAQHEREACINAIKSTDRHRSDYFIAKIREDRGQE